MPAATRARRLRICSEFLGPGHEAVGFAEGMHRHCVQWNETFDVEIGPHPDLTPSQQAVVAKDYGMKNGRAILTVRYAMLFYVLKRLGLLGDATKVNPQAQHIVLLNREATDAALKAADLKL